MTTDDKGNGDGQVLSSPPVVLAQIVALPNGQMGFVMAPQVDQPVLFCLAVINLVSGAALENAQKLEQQKARIIKPPPGLILPRQ